MSAMLYDQAAGPPASGSLLESVFVLLAKTQKETEYYKTKLLVAATLAPHVKEGDKTLGTAWDDYRSSIFPFLAKQKGKKDIEAKKLLNWWGQRMMKIRPLWRPKDSKGLVSKLKRGQERVRNAEESRKSRPHRRI